MIREDFAAIAPIQISAIGNITASTTMRKRKDPSPSEPPRPTMARKATQSTPQITETTSATLSAGSSEVSAATRL